MSKRKITIEDVTPVLFQPVPEFQIIHEKSALLLINFLDYKDFFVRTAVKAGILEAEAHEVLNDFDLRARSAADNAGKLLKICRDKGLEIVHVKQEKAAEELEGTSKVSRDTGLINPPKTETLNIYEAVRPRKGELVFSKADGEAFAGTRLDFVLRNMHVDTLIVCGLMTDQGVLYSTVHAVDLGYKVILVEDACTTFTREAHEIFIKWYRTFVKVKMTEQVLNLIQKK